MSLWKTSIREWLVDTGQALLATSGERIRILELRLHDEPEVIDAWAAHFRNQYCRDEDIDYLREGPGLSRAEFLRQLKLPTREKGLGPSTRAGDFAEILLSDYLAFVLDYWVPRTRYSDKTIRNESTKGSDTIAFRIVQDGAESDDDELLVVEVKASLAGKKPLAKLQDAVADSAKDYLRLAESLNAMKQHIFKAEGKIQADRIARFQNPDDRPYKALYGAAAVLSSLVYDPDLLAKTTTIEHHASGTMLLWVVRGTDLMDFVHSLYERACDGA